MNCSPARRLFDELYREGDHCANTEASAHVHHCAECGRAYREWCGIAHQLEDAPAILPPDVFDQKLRCAIEEEMRAGRGRSATVLCFPRPLAWAALFLFALCGFFAVRHFHHNGAPLSSGTAGEFATLHFTLAAKTAAVVTVAGDFNGWDTEKHRLLKAADGTWTIDLRVPQGSYQYLFFIDGKEWRVDPSNCQLAPDGFGGTNSEITL